MANENKILTAEQEKKLLQPIDDYVGKIQSKIDALRADGTEKVISLQDEIDSLKKDKIYTKEEKDARLAAAQSALDKAKAVEAQNKDEIAKLIADAENYLKAHYDAEYYQPVCESCKEEKVLAQEKYSARKAELEKGEPVEALRQPGDQGREVRSQEPPFRRQDGV